MKKIKTQKELDNLVKTGIKVGEEVEIVGEGLRLNANLNVYGYLSLYELVRVIIYFKKQELKRAYKNGWNKRFEL